MLRSTTSRAGAGAAAAAPRLRACPQPVAGTGLAFDVPGGRAAPGAARRVLEERDGALPEGARADLLLLLSELVSNAVLHGRVGAEGRIGVRLDQEPGQVRVEVVDAGTGFDWERRRRERPRREGGFGLALVERIAERWGIERENGLTRVWFELTTHPR